MIEWIINKIRINSRIKIYLWIQIENNHNNHYIRIEYRLNNQILQLSRIIHNSYFHHNLIRISVNNRMYRDRVNNIMFSISLINRIDYRFINRISRFNNNYNLLIVCSIKGINPNLNKEWSSHLHVKEWFSLLHIKEWSSLLHIE